MANSTLDGIADLCRAIGRDEADLVAALDRYNDVPSLAPLFPIGYFTPTSACPHRLPIRQGSAFCCMVCHRSGLDHHPALQRDRRFDPKPDRKPDAVPVPGKQTRRERRARRRDEGAMPPTGDEARES